VHGFAVGAGGWPAVHIYDVVDVAPNTRVKVGFQENTGANIRPDVKSIIIIEKIG
jgi:hypothetical protein